MKKILLILALLAFLNIDYAQVTTYSPGSTVDNFTVTDTQGNTHTLYDITASGKYVFLDFFFTTCPPCQQTQKYFNELHDKYGCNTGEVYTLSITGYPGDYDDKVDQFEATYGGSFNHSPAISLDGNGAAVDSQFGIGAYPTYCLIGPDNKLISGDIWPIGSVASYEVAFPAGVSPTPIPCTGLNTLTDSFEDFKVYPTITDGMITIELAKVSEATITIYNLEGKTVFNTFLEQNNKFQIQPDLSSGIYMLTIRTVEGQSKNKKIILK